MKYGKIIYFDIANGEGCRTSLFVSGCTHHCSGCFNSVAWDFDYGDEFTTDVENTIIDSLKPDYVVGLSILGGEPMEPSNQAVLLPFIRKVKRIYPNKTIWVYSGYTWEQLINGLWFSIEILNDIDVLVDGEFVEGLKDLRLQFRGSSNQRIIDVKKSLQEGEVRNYIVYGNKQR